MRRLRLPLSLGVIAMLLVAAPARAGLAAPHSMRSPSTLSSPYGYVIGNWQVVSSPNTSTTVGNTLDSVAAISVSDVWAVGYIGLGAPFSSTTLTEHWDGSSWSIVSSPNPGTASDSLSGVAAASSNDVWAVGYKVDKGVGINQSLIEHWNGTSWSSVTAPGTGNFINGLAGVAAVSSSDVWAVGATYASGLAQTLIDHWNGTSWSVVPSPNGGPEDSLNAIAVVSANDIWAVGGISPGGATQTLTEHWNGTQWSVVSSPNVGSENNGLRGVAAISANDVWAVGSSGYSNLSLTEHWNGTSWSVVPSPNVGSYDQLFGVMALSSNDVWTVGSCYVGAPSNQQQTLIEHWDGTTWGVAFSPSLGSYNNALLGVAGVPQSWLWAVGYYSIGPSGSISQTLTGYFLDRDFYSSSGGAPPLVGAGRAPAHMRHYPPRR